MINVALVDDHVIVRSGFAQLLSLETDMNVVGEFSSVAEARMRLPACKPDVVILDISMADESGLTLLSEIPSGIACVMLSVHDSPAMVEKSLKLGAKGAEQIGRDLIADGVTGADAQLAGKGLVIFKQVVEIFGAAEQFIGQRQELLPFLIEDQPVVDPIKQRVPELLLQFRERHADRRFGEEQHLGRRRQGFVLRDGGEHAQLFEGNIGCHFR